MSSGRALPTREQVAARISYDPATGLFARKAFVTATGHYRRADAGRPITHGRKADDYILITVCGYPYLAHRLAYLMMLGEWPRADTEIDHKNGDRKDNRWVNLRPASRTQNSANRKVSSKGVSGIKGVTWDPITGRWRARISVGYRDYSLGRHDTKEEAAEAYAKGAAKYFGEFARVQDMKRAANQPTSELALYAGIYCKTWHVPDSDTVLPQHSHDFPHLSYIVSGSVRVYRAGEYAGEFTAPASIRIPARQAHTFQTLVPNVTILCIHNADHADPDGEPPIHAEHHIVED